MKIWRELGVWAWVVIVERVICVGGDSGEGDMRGW